MKEIGCKVEFIKKKLAHCEPDCIGSPIPSGSQDTDANVSSTASQVFTRNITSITSVCPFSHPVIVFSFQPILNKNFSHVKEEECVFESITD